MNELVLVLEAVLLLAALALAHLLLPAARLLLLAAHPLVNRLQAPAALVQAPALVPRLFDIITSVDVVAPVDTTTRAVLTRLGHTRPRSTVVLNTTIHLPVVPALAVPRLVTTIARNEVEESTVTRVQAARPAPLLAVTVPAARLVPVLVPLVIAQVPLAPLVTVQAPLAHHHPLAVVLALVPHPLMNANAREDLTISSVGRLLR